MISLNRAPRQGEYVATSTTITSALGAKVGPPPSPVSTKSRNHNTRKNDRYLEE